MLDELDNRTSYLGVADLRERFDQFQAVGHGCEGSAGLVTVGVMGAVFALVYLWRRSLVAPIVMHFLQYFLSIVLLPLLGLT